MSWREEIEWDEETGMPVHLRMGVDKDGNGPVTEFEPDYDRDICWCGVEGCTKYLVGEK